MKIYQILEDFRFLAQKRPTEKKIKKTPRYTLWILITFQMNPTFCF